MHNQIKFKKILKEEFDKLKPLSPESDEMWIKYRDIRLNQFDNNEIDIFVIEYNDEFIAEITINYRNHDLESETIPNVRVYLEAFRVKKQYQSKGLGQQLIEYVVDTLEKEGYTQFTIGVEDNNRLAKHIYFKYGFKKAIDKGKGNEFDPCDYTLYLKEI